LSFNNANLITNYAVISGLHVSLCSEFCIHLLLPTIYDVQCNLSAGCYTSWGALPKPYGAWRYTWSSSPHVWTEWNIQKVYFKPKSDHPVVRDIVN